MNLLVGAADRRSLPKPLHRKLQSSQRELSDTHRHRRLAVAVMISSQHYFKAVPQLS